MYSFARLGALEFYTMAIYLSYFFVPHIVAFGLWTWDRPRFKSYVIAFMVTLYAGLLVSAVLPTAPPWLAGQLGYIPHVYHVVPEIAGHVRPGTYENVYEIAGANPVAAMPSLHVAVPFVMAFALWKYSWLRWLGVAYAISMLFAVVYLGEHYAVDGFAGLGLAAAAWAGARAYLARREAPAEKGATEDGSAASPAPGESPRIGESASPVTGR
jgi:membrane-associated phospholipid phosphatase